MKLACRLKWHQWGQWQWVPVTNDPAKQWSGGQIRYCANCNLADLKTYNNNMVGVSVVKPTECSQKTNG